MRTLRVDFAPPSPWRVRSLWFGSAAILAIALWQGGLAWKDYCRLRTEREEASALQHRLEVASASAVPAPVAASAPSYERDAQEIARMASFDVGGVFRAIESAQVVGAKVASVDIDTQARGVNLALDVSTADVATAYVRALNGDDLHPSWRLARVQVQAGGDRAEVRGEFP